MFGVACRGARGRGPATLHLVAAATLVAMGLVLAAPSTARAASTASDASVRLVAQPVWVPMGFGPAWWDLRLSGEQPGDQVVVDVHAGVSTRKQFAQTVFGADLGPILGRRVIDVADLQRRRHGVVRAIFPTLARGATGDRNSLQVDGGVYPVRIRLRDSSGNTRDQFTTWLVADDLTRPAPEPYDVALVVPVDAPPAELPDGTIDPRVVQAMRPGGRLASITEALADVPESPVSVLPSPETVETWRRVERSKSATADGLDALRIALSHQSRQVLPSPYVRLDVPSLEANGLTDELVTQLNAGVDSLSRSLRIRVDPRLQVVSPADPAALDAVRRSAFADRVVVDDTDLAGAPTEPPGGRVRLTTGSTSFDAGVNDTFLSDLLSGQDTPALVAQRFLAGLAVESLERRDTSRVGGTVVVAPREWDDSPGVLASVLRGLSEHPLLRPTTLDDWFAKVPTATDERGAALTLGVRTQPARAPGVTSDQLTAARADLESLRRLVGAGDVRVARGERAILDAPYAGFASADGRARVAESLSQIPADAASFLSGVTTTARTITLTGRRATIPLTMRNTTGRPVRVEVSLDSSKLLFPRGRTKLVTLPPGASTTRLPVEARATGTFEVQVSLRTADDRYPIGDTTMTVRTGLFEGLGAWLTVGAALFLAAWWLAHHLRRRRPTGDAAAPA
jgi:hypothetical protein